MNRSQRTLNALNDKQKFHQAENAALDYTVNWSPVLQSDTIESSTWEADGATVSSGANTDTETSCIISGTPRRYNVVNKITTAAGITDERILCIEIKENTRKTTDYQ